MRVTNTMFPNSLVRQLHQLNTRQNRLQTEVATGQRLQSPDDNPAAMRRVLDMQAEARALTQYKSNITRLKDQTAASASAASSLRKISDRISEIATLADGTRSRSDLEIFATEVTQLIQQAVQVMNAQNQGDYVFSGTASKTAPFTLATDSDGRVTSVTYNGNTTINAVEISAGTTLTVGAVGANSSGSGPRGLITDSRTGADFFNHMIALQDNLLAGNTTAIADTVRPQLDADEQNIITQIAGFASLTARLEAVDVLATERGDSLGKLISREADADLAETIVRLSETQNAYKAALQSGATILNLSLLDYLR